MNQRNALAVSACITAFILVIAGAVAAYFARGGTASHSASATPATLAQETTTTASDTGPDLQTLIDQREATYRQQLEQANRQLQQANAQLQQAYKQLQAQTPTAVPVPSDAGQTQFASSAPAYAVTPEQAAIIALNAVPGSMLSRTPEVVNYQGSVAYEVQLDGGPVYVDAQSGQILDYAPSGAGPASPPAIVGAEGEQDDLHEGSESGGD